MALAMSLDPPYMMRSLVAPQNAYSFPANEPSDVVTGVLDPCLSYYSPADITRCDYDLNLGVRIILELQHCPYNINGPGAKGILHGDGMTNLGGLMVMANSLLILNCHSTPLCQL